MFSNRKHITECRLLLHCLATDSHSGTICESHYTFIREKFSWTSMTLSMDDGARELHLAFIVNPASEKILSDRALVAGMASTTLASFANVGYVCCCDSHHVRVLSGATNRHRNCWISCEPEGADTMCFKRSSCLAFFSMDVSCHHQ